MGSKLIVLGPTPALPTDFQIIKQIPHTSNNQSRNNVNIINNGRINQDERLAMINNHRENNRIQPQNHRIPVPVPAVNLPQNNQRNVHQNNNNNNNQAQQQNQNHDDVAQRLQRNLQQLRNRDDECLLPKRFNEPYHERFGMAAFRVQPSPNQSAARERQIEILRRMQNKYHHLRRVNNQPPKLDESSSPKRAKRNCIAMFVCDLSKILTSEGVLEWLEYKNYGIAAGAPERLILSTIVAGKGELIMFGGLLKETLINETVQVSNAVHFLTTPRGVF